MIVIGVDTGGTFTDFVFRKGNAWTVYKVLSTPVNPAEAVLRGLRHIAGDNIKQITHGSTVATNAILERKGARTALVTNAGFEDVIRIGRQNRGRLYDLAYRKDPTLVEPDLSFGVRGRILHTGEEKESLDEERAQEIVQLIREQGVASVAVSFLFSFLNPSHEQRMAELLGEAGVHVSLSHEILSEFREFERTSTTVVNAYVSPRMHGYIGHLMSRLGERDRLSIMQSNGGSISAETAMRESVRTILSGPAGGAVGACEIGRVAGLARLIGFDMGGTSTDVCLIDGGLSLSMESSISGYPIRVPMLDIHTVGAGGGSIAVLDPGGALRVGPESAGADPGPICYGKGDRITVTDANLFLGRLVPEHFLGGGIRLETERLGRHFEQMAKRAHLTGVELAEGVLAVANAAMEKAIRVISVEKGHDPREFTLFSYGGAGGVHAAFLAKLLGIPRVLVPQHPGILSAIGMLMADVIKDYSVTVMRQAARVSRQELMGLFHDLEVKGVRDLAFEGVKEKDLVFERFLDMRYEGQSYEIMTPLQEDWVEDFHGLHEKTYGYRNPGRRVQIVTIRLRVRGTPEKPVFPKAEGLVEKIPDEALLGEQAVVFDRNVVSTQAFLRERLLPGNRIQGPAILCEYSATTVVPPFGEARVDAYGNVILEIKT
jgi:N-methylhydantoinase A